MAVTCVGTGDPFQQPRQALGLPGFSGAGPAFNSIGTGPGIADGWRTSDAAGPGAQTLTGTKRPAADPPRAAGDGLPGELGAVAGYGPSGIPFIAAPEVRHPSPMRTTYYGENIPTARGRLILQTHIIRL